jgi:pilus assembly protein Flp/PilA
VTLGICKEPPRQAIIKSKNKKFIGGANMLNNFKNYISSVLRNEKGQGMVEYALLVGLIAIVVIVALLALGPALAQKFTDITNSL